MDKTRRRYVPMAEKRHQERFLCSDLVTLVWREPGRGEVKEFAVLENLSRSGASLFTEVAIPDGCAVEIVSRGVSLRGVTRHLTDALDGNVVGVEFEQGSEWTNARYTPKHMLDPGGIAGAPESW
jgi:hypothetical protein